MEYGIGEFGDGRLKKGGHFYIGVWLKSARAGFPFARLGATGLARSDWAVFCATVR